MTQVKTSKETHDKIMGEIKKIDHNFRVRIAVLKKEQRAAIEKIYRRIDNKKLDEVRRRFKK